MHMCMHVRTYLSDMYMVVGEVWSLLCRTYIQVRMYLYVLYKYMYLWLEFLTQTDSHTCCTKCVHVLYVHKVCNVVDLRLRVIMARSCYNIHIRTYIHMYVSIL